MSAPQARVIAPCLAKRRDGCVCEKLYGHDGSHRDGDEFWMTGDGVPPANACDELSEHMQATGEYHPPCGLHQAGYDCTFHGTAKECRCVQCFECFTGRHERCARECGFASKDTQHKPVPDGGGKP